MSSCIEVGASSSTEQLCYIPCNFCNIVLASITKSHLICSTAKMTQSEKGYMFFFWLKKTKVSVPCSSLYEIVTVRCGHCSNIWSVNMAAAAFQAFSNFHHQQQYAQAPNNMNSSEYRIDLGSSSVRCNNNKMAIRQPTMIPSEQRIVNPPPEKRQRVPSAYNQFIKEEIQRIKANNPDISHREAFSTAAKNWAHFPHIHFGLMLESNNNQPKLDDQNAGKFRTPRAALLNK